MSQGHDSLKNRKSEAAAGYYSKAQSIFERSGDNVELLYLKFPIAHTYLDLHQTEHALATFQDVIRESEQASAVVFVNFNAVDDWLMELAGDDASVQENLAPLAGFGVAVWQDDDWTHGVLRVTTD